MRLKKLQKKRFTQFNIGIAGRGQESLNQIEIYRVEKKIYQRLNNVINPFVFYKKTKFSIIKFTFGIFSFKREFLYSKIRKFIKFINFLLNKR